MLQTLSVRKPIMAFMGLKIILIPYLVLQVISTVLAVVSNLLYIPFDHELTLGVGCEEIDDPPSTSVCQLIAQPQVRES